MKNIAQGKLYLLMMHAGQGQDQIFQLWCYTLISNESYTCVTVTTDGYNTATEMYPFIL